MSIQDNITADQVALEAAQAKLAADTATDQAAIDEIQAQLVADQAKLAGIQPHLDALAAFKANFLSIEQGLDATEQAVSAKFQPLLDSFIADMTAALLG